MKKKPRAFTINRLIKELINEVSAREELIEQLTIAMHALIEAGEIEPQSRPLDSKRARGRPRKQSDNTIQDKPD